MSWSEIAVAVTGGAVVAAGLAYATLGKKKLPEVTVDVTDRPALRSAISHSIINRDHLMLDSLLTAAAVAAKKGGVDYASVKELCMSEKQWVGNIVLVKQFWDGAVDPFVGAASDSIDTRWGRRRPFCLLALGPMLIFWVLQWCAPGWVVDNDVAKISYYMAVILLSSFFTSMFYVPYQAVIPDLAPTYHTRTTLVLGVRVFGLLGSGTASYLWQHVVDYFPVNGMGADEGLEGMASDYRKGYLWAAVIFCVPILVSSIIGIGAIRELPHATDPDLRYLSAKKRVAMAAKGLGKTLVRFLLFPPFLILVGLHVLSAICIALFTSNLLLFFKYVLLEPQWTPIGLLVLQGTIVLSLGFWFFVCSRVGVKVVSFVLGITILSAAFTWIYFIDAETEIYMMMLALALMGLGASAASLMTNAMIPDVLEMYQHKTDERKEALFYGLFGFLDTLAQGVAGLYAGYALAYTGYLNPAQLVDGAEQPEAALTMMVWNVSLTPLIVTSICFPLAVLYYVVVERKYKSMKSVPPDNSFVAGWSDEEDVFTGERETGSLTSGSEFLYASELDDDVGSPS